MYSQFGFQLALMFIRRVNDKKGCEPNKTIDGYIDR